MHHRVDLKYYPIEEYAFALLYFTGSGMFNRQLRLVATGKGLQLSDHGAVRRDKKGKGEVWKGDIPKCLTEKDVLDMLGVDWKEPKDRDL